MKYLILILAVTMISCNGKKEAEAAEAPANAPATPAINPRMLIVPGQSIGNIALEMNADKLDSILGKPDLSDAAMGKAWLTWFSKVSDSVTGNELNIYTTYKDNELTEKVVRQIRITSPEFKTQTGISTGKAFQDISAKHTNLVAVGSYDTETPHPVSIYDDVALGIAFEIENNACVGIIVHERGREVSKEYITFHPDMKPI